MAIEKHLTEYPKECWQIKIKSCLRFWRATWFYYKITQRVIIKSKIDIRVRSLWWLANVQSQMFIELSQLMAMALSGQSINASFRILERPKMMEDLPVLQIFMMGYKFPPLILNQCIVKHTQFHMDTPLT